MKRITLLTGLIAGAMTLQAAPREPQQMTATLQKGAVVVTNGRAPVHIPRRLPPVPD